MSQTYNLSLTPEKSFVVDLSVSGGVDNYEKLKNLPTLNGVELKGDLTSVDLNLVGRDEIPPVEEIATKSEIPDVSGFALTSQLPTKTSQLTNDSNFAYKSELPVVPTKVSAFENDKGYLTQHQDVSHLATKSELSSKADKSELPVIPTKVSAFENDMGYLTQHQDISNLATKAELNSKANKSDIPTKTSQLTNDSGFVTKEEIGDIDSPVLEEAKQIIDKYAIANRVLDTENVKSYPSVADGYLNDRGTINSSSTRGTSDYIDLSEYPMGIHIQSGVAGIKDGGYTYACFYDENKVFISNLVGAHGELGEQDILNYPENAKYIRLTLTAKGTPLKLMAYYGDKYYDYDIARESDLNTVTAEVNELTERLGDFDVNNMPDTTEINKFLSDYAEIVLSDTSESYSSIVNAYLSATGTEMSSTSRGITDYIDLSLYPIGLHIVSGVSAIQNGLKTYACFYDKDKVFISNLAHTSSGAMDGTDILEYPENAKYIRFTCTANTTPMVVCGYVSTGNFDIARKKDFEKVLTEKVNNHKNYGKSIGVFGGSLSVRQESNVAKQIWKDTLNATVTSYGVGGAGFSSLTGTTPIQTQVDGAGVHDVYVLWASTNDCTSSKEVGEWTDYTKFDNYDESKLTTQCGGINYCIKKLYEKNPNAEIYFFTGLRFFSAEYGYNPYSTVKNAVGKTFSEYVEAQKRCCEYNGIPVLDQFNLHGVGLFNYTLYYDSDKLHMNEEGYKKIGYVQAEFLKNGFGIPKGKDYTDDIKAKADKENVLELLTQTTLANNTIFRGGEMANLELLVPSSLDTTFICEVDFTSGATATAFTMVDTVKWRGDDITDGSLVPVANKRYSVLVWFDGTFVRAESEGVEL